MLIAICIKLKHVACNARVFAMAHIILGDDPETLLMYVRVEGEHARERDAHRNAQPRCAVPRLPTREEYACAMSGREPVCLAPACPYCGNTDPRGVVHPMLLKELGVLDPVAVPTSIVITCSCTRQPGHDMRCLACEEEFRFTPSEGIFGQHDVCNTIPVCKSFMERIVKDGVLVPVSD